MLSMNSRFRYYQSEEKKLFHHISLAKITVRTKGNSSTIYKLVINLPWDAADMPKGELMYVRCSPLQIRKKSHTFTQLQINLLLGAATSYGSLYKLDNITVVDQLTPIAIQNAGVGQMNPAFPASPPTSDNWSLKVSCYLSLDSPMFPGQVEATQLWLHLLLTDWLIGNIFRGNEMPLYYHPHILCQVWQRLVSDWTSQLEISQNNEIPICLNTTAHKEKPMSRIQLKIFLTICNFFLPPQTSNYIVQQKCLGLP